MFEIKLIYYFYFVAENFLLFTTKISTEHNSFITCFDVSYDNKLCVSFNMSNNIIELDSFGNIIRTLHHNSLGAFNCFYDADNLVLYDRRNSIYYIYNFSNLVDSYHEDGFNENVGGYWIENSNILVQNQDYSYEYIHINYFERLFSFSGKQSHINVYNNDTLVYSISEDIDIKKDLGFVFLFFVSLLVVYIVFKYRKKLKRINKKIGL